MSKEFLCADENYFISNDTIALLVTFANLPSIIECEGLTLHLKSSFHISLVCMRHLIERHKLPETALDDFTKAFCEFAKTHDLSAFTLRDEFRLVTENDLQSLIVMCSVPHLEALFSHLSTALGVSLETPPSHITLYTKQPDAGIYVVNEHDLNEKTRMVARPGTLQTLRT